MIFFDPRPEFMDWLKNYVRGRLVVDCGAGDCQLSRLAASRRIDVLSIDLFPSGDETSMALTRNAATFDYPRNSVALIARPCRGAWIHDTIYRALAVCDYVLYVGLLEHLTEDVDELQGVNVELVYKDAGKDNERVYKISKEKRLDKTTYYLVMCYNGVNSTYPNTSWYERSRDRWVNFNGGWRSIVASDEVLDEVEADDVHDLDWRRTDMVDEKSTAGWLDREGRYTGCDSQAHDMVADLVFNKSVQEMEDQGFVRIYGSDAYVCTKRMTPDQRTYMQGRGFILREDE